MDQFTGADLHGLIAPTRGPCVSIFSTTHRGDGVDDRPRWKEQIHEAQRRLLHGGATPEAIDSILAPAYAHLGNEKADFWKHASDSLAAFFAPGFSRLYRLPATLADRVVVGPHFHVTPLLGYVADDGRFFTLALSRHQVRLLEGTAHSWRRVEVADMPHSLAESRPANDRDEPLNLHTHRAAGGTGVQAVFHGQGVGIDDRKTEFHTFCRAIDQAILPVLGEARAPLVLATVEYMAAIYRSASRYNRLAPEIIRGNPDHTSDPEMHERAWALVAPLFRAQNEQTADRYHQLAGTGRTTDRLEELLPAVARGEVETLMLAAGREALGRFDPETHRVEELSADAPEAEDLVNLAAIHALKRDRRTVVVNPEVLGSASAAGIYFTPMNKHGK